MDDKFGQLVAESPRELLAHTNLTERLRSAESSMPWLQSWKPWEDVPADRVPALTEGLTIVEQALEPASVRAFGVCMAPMIEWVQRFGVIPLAENKDQRRKQVADIVSGYREPLADLPPDLLDDAIRETIASHRFRALPLPGDLRARVQDELTRRHDLRRKMITAVSKATPSRNLPRPRSEEPAVRQMETGEGDGE